MPTDIEVRVMKVLTAIDFAPAQAAAHIQNLGNEGVTVVAEAALGTFPGLRAKVRTNAVALLGYIDHQQASEALQLLLLDPDPDVAIRAMRAAGRKRSAAAVDRLVQMLTAAGTAPLLAAEAAKALIAIDTPEARAAVSAYAEANPATYPHRGSSVVRSVLQNRREA